MKMKITILSWLLCLCVSGWSQNREKASFVWTEPTGEGRQVFVFFRRDLTFDKLPQKVQINLFVDSRYQLYVNGTMINFGPVRFYPQHPQYDTYDILPFLKTGKNTVAVKALSNGVHTYQVPKHVGGFIAWGEILSASGEKISFETPGEWLCKPAEGYDRQMPKATFALHIGESYDARKDPADWNLPSSNISDWHKPVPVIKQDAWGTLEPRGIPYLTQNYVAPKKVLGIYELKDDANIYSYRIKVPDENEKLYAQGQRLFAYTYIYSPKNQQADIDGWWSEWWLNGDSVSFDQANQGLVKRIWHLNLKEGWNYLFVKYGTVDGIWDAYYKVPKKYDLIFSADKNKESDIIFYTAGPFAENERAKVMALPLPLSSPDKLPKLSATWTPRKKSESAASPSWDMLYSDLGKDIPTHPSNIGDIVSAKPIAWIGDMGGKQLARFSIDIDAPAGTIIEAAFTEDTTGIRPWVLKRPMVYLAARFVTREGKNHFETFNPYGCRFMQVNIINNNNKPFTVHQIGMISQVYPLDKKGSFLCSDPMFNSLWEMGWRTLQVCSEDSYVDTPFRERGLYAGDCLPEFATTMATAGDPLLIKRCLELFHDMYGGLFLSGADQVKKKKSVAGGLTGIGDFSMITTLYFNWYFDRTKDIDFVKKLYPGYKKMIVDAAEKNQQKNGLIKTGGQFVEWTKIRRENYCCTFSNSLYARNCEILSNMASILGYADDAAWFKEKSKQVVAAISKYCWDPAKGAFRDGLAGDTALKSYYPISSSIVALFGYTTPEQNAKISVFLDESLKDIGSKVRDGLATSYGGFYVLGGLYRNGDAGIAEHFIRRYWSPMLLYLDDTMWEDFAENSSLIGSGTLSHAWSSAPTYYLSTQALGVQLGFPTDAGNLNTINIEPQSESLTWAKGDVPHPKGQIHVDWKIQGDNLFLNCSVPEGVEYRVKPRGRLAGYTLWINGKKQ